MPGGTGKLPAALVATFPGPDPNVLRDGELRAYDSAACALPQEVREQIRSALCDTPKRLVWVEISARAVTRVFVRQGSTTHTWPCPTSRGERASNARGVVSRGLTLIVGTSMPSTDRRRVMTCWLRVSRSGVPSIVSRGITDWVYVALSPRATRPLS